MFDRQFRSPGSASACEGSPSAFQRPKTLVGLKKQLAKSIGGARGPPHQPGTRRTSVGKLWVGSYVGNIIAEEAEKVREKYQPHMAVKLVIGIK